MKENITVIGAGISGLAISKMLKDDFDVQLLEKSEKVGGLVKCDLVDGVLFHKVGGHVFNAKNKEVFDWFWSHFDQNKEFIKATRNAKILINSKIIGYPIENYLYEFDKQLVSSIIKELLESQNKNKSVGQESSNFESFLKSNFGETLFELYFKPYNQKIWNTDLSKVPLGWLEGKLPMPNIQEIIVSNIKREEDGSMVHSTFYYPCSGGSQFVADRLSQDLKVINNTSIISIEFSPDGIILNKTILADKAIYTGDIRKLSQIIRTNSEQLNDALSQVVDFKSNGTSNLLCECDDNDISWLYIPEDFTRAHRIIYTGNFSVSNNGNKRKTCVVEFSGLVELKVMQAEIKKLPGNLKPIKHNYEPNSYVIQEIDTRKKVDNLKSLLEPLGIYLLGRFAEWEYYNMDKAIESAMCLSIRLK
jgi:protoporphyrinogen oxidase